MISDIAAAAGDLLITIHGNGDQAIDGINYDSRRVRKGDLFFCVPGAKSDGHDFAADAVQAGAVALCAERDLPLGVPTIQVTDVRRAMPLMAAEFLGRPSDSLLLLGVTGTNGKTTTAYLLDSILRTSGHITGLIGTIETRIGGDVAAGVRTTPESLDLQQLFARMRDSGVTAAAMEVTSHALELHRVDGVRFDAAAFTNLTQDHLDFHGDMEKYFLAKASLFRPDRVTRGVFNVDDAHGRRLAHDVTIDRLTFGVLEPADVAARDVVSYARGMSFELVTPAGTVAIETGLVGSFNVSNCLAAAATALASGISLDEIASGIASLGNVPGRLERVDVGQPFMVLVDYAHTPDSLANVLHSARDLGTRVICVFGCGGDRDRGKRPLMGAAAARLADVVVVTSDNPRSEVPQAIVDEIIAGVRQVRPDGPDAAMVDRADAIRHSLEMASPGDVVVIAGKGHETGQEFADRTIPFDDRIVARDLLLERKSA